MISKRVVAISADKALGKRLAAGLTAAGAMVESASTPDDLARGEINADLVAIDIAGGDGLLKSVAARLKKDCHLVAVIPSSSLAATVQAMQAASVSAVLVADQLEPATLASAASRLLYGDVFGLEKVVPWGVRIYSTLVGDYQEKSVAISAISDFATAMGVRRKYRESIEQCLDELLMNALYDAPVDTTGRQMFADVPTKTRISLRMEQKAVVQYACDGNFFAISVRDSFGALGRDTVLKFLDKCLNAEQQIDRKAGGAGLGLYIVTNAATQFMLNFYPGVATEAICTFDLEAPKVQLKELALFNEKIDSSGRLVGGPSKLVTSGSSAGVSAPVQPQVARGVLGALVAAIVLLLALIAIVAYPRFAGRPLSSIAISTSPPGAVIELDGRAVGSTGEGATLTIDDLEVGQKYKVTARLDGYELVNEIVSPLKDVTAPVQFTLKPKASTVAFETDPPGAAVIIDGEEFGFTPLTVTSLPSGAVKQYTLRRMGYGEVTKELRVPPPGQGTTVNAALTMAGDFASVRIESQPAGAEVLQNGELLAGLRTPVAEHLVQAKREYTFTLKQDGFMPAHVKARVQPGARDVVVKAMLQPGGGLTVESNAHEAVVTVDKVPACKNRRVPMLDCPLKNGRYTVRVTATRPYLSERFDVTINGKQVRRELEVGFVEAAEGLVLQVPGGPRQLAKAAFAEGTQQLTVLNPATGESAVRSIRVLGGRTLTVGLTE